MIKIIESFRKKNEHLVFNSQILKIISNIEIDNIKFYSKKSHFTEIQKIIDMKKIIYVRILGNENNGKIKNLFGYLLSAFYDVMVLLLSSKQDKLIYTTINPFSLYFIRNINKILKRKVYMFCHGELEVLLKKDKYGFLERIYMRAYNSKVKDNIKYIVLGESIYNNLIEINEIQNKNYVYIDHPYIYDLEKLSTKKENKKTKILGSVGLATKEKGSHLLFELAEKLKMLIEKKEIEFHLVGKINFRIIDNDLVHYSKEKTMLSKLDFDKKISNLDYILYFYPIDSYKLIASGAFFDALSHRKPIIALKNDFFEYYFKKYGEIGYLVEDITEFEMILKNDLKSEYKYNNFVKNIEKMIGELSDEKISEQIKNWWYK